MGRTPRSRYQSCLVLAQATILVVDDDAADRSHVAHVLEGEGHRVVSTGAGAEAIAAFDREQPECVLLDVQTLAVEGFSVCERIQALPHGSETPVVFLASVPELDTFARPFRADGDDFVTKPVRARELVVRVRSALERRRSTIASREHVELRTRQRDDLLALQQQKERLVAFAVHDLKNPVNAIGLNAQLLLGDLGLPPNSLQAAARIETGTRRLTRMLHDLLDLSKAEEGRLAPEASPIDLRRLIEEVVSELDAEARSRKVTLETSLRTERLSVDEGLFRRTLTNLVENAIRYAPPETSVTIVAGRRVGATELRVADTGSGVPPELRETIFGAFVQVGSSEHLVEYGSRGLGLTFCKLAVEAHGGSIWIEDGSPGTVFCMRLPDAP